MKYIICYLMAWFVLNQVVHHQHIKVLKELVAAQKQEINYWTTAALLMRERLRLNGLWDDEAC